MEPLREASASRLIELFGRPLPESFVRTHHVIELLEAVEALLLLEHVGTCRTRCFCLESSMHTFVAPVLLGTCRLDPFETDPEP